MLVECIHEMMEPMAAIFREADETKKVTRIHLVLQRSTNGDARQEVQEEREAYVLKALFLT